MTHPLTPHEKVRQIVDCALNSAIPEPWEVANHATDAIITALASGSGDHADHSGGVTDMVDHAELCERLRDTYIRFNMGHREAPLRNPDGPLAAEALEGLLAENAALRSVIDGLKDATTVHVNMLRGGIVKPPARNIGHLYRGECATEVINEVERQNPGSNVRATEAERKLAEAVGVIERLASSEAFDIPRAIDGPLAAEVRARMDYARNYISKEAERG